MPEVVTLIDELDPALLEAARSEIAFCAQRTPEVAALATVASLARSIEPELLRSLRVGLGPRISGTHISVSAESALWFSNLVESRGADAITLLPEALRVLRPQLAGNQQLLEDARAIVEDCHKSAPDVLQWEELIVYLALTGRTALLEEEVLRGLRSISSGPRQPLANWISDMWLRLPPEASANPLIGKLYQVATGLTRRRVQSVQSQGSSANDLVLDFSSFPTRELGVVLREDRLLVGDLPEAEFGIEVPDLEPVELDVSFGTNQAWEDRVIERGQLAEIEVLNHETIRVRTLAGRTYELAISFFRPKPRLRVFISYSHDSAAHSERVLAFSERLRADGIQTLLDQDVNGSPPQGWSRWQQKQIARANFIIVVCTEGYHQRLIINPDFDERGRADWASFLSTQEMYSSRDKLIPVCLTRDDERYIPEHIRSSTDYILDSDDAYEDLVRRLTGQPATPKPFAPDQESIRSAGTYDISRIIKYGPAELIGREHEMKLLDDAWGKVVRGETRRPHILTFVGLGGEGKTSLVAKWTADLAHRDWPGCDAAFAWSFYSQGAREHTLASADLFLKEALTFFGDRETANSAAGAFDKGRRLAELVAQRPALVILDGLEPLQYSPVSPTPGGLNDQGVSALLKALAANNRGLCIVTTRYSIPDLRAFWNTSVVEEKLEHLSRDAGVHLLRTLGVRGTQTEFGQLVDEVKGHALTLNLLGSYLRDAHGGDIRKRDLVKLEEADLEQRGGSSFRMYATYIRWLESEGEAGQRSVALLRLLGLFDGPARIDYLNALWKGEVITGLTEPLISISESERNLSLMRLEETKLLTVIRGASGEIITIDAHPMLREYLAQQLTTNQPDAWRSANRRLYEHLCKTTVEGDEPTLEDLQPLAQAIRFGCEAGLFQESLDDVYFKRMHRGDEGYILRQLGAFNFDLGVITHFFEHPWSRVSPALPELDQGLVLNNAAFDLRALGRLAEALEPMRAAFEVRVKQEDWKTAAISAGHLSELGLALGDVSVAVNDAERAVTYADRSGDAFERTNNRTTHADALHQAGRRAEALEIFREAEQMQERVQPDYPLLYSVRGFNYCDLLLATAERAAWRNVQRSEVGSQRSEVSELLQTCRAVNERAAQTLKWEEGMGGAPLLDSALHHLTLGRATLFSAILSNAEIRNATLEIEHAINGLRRAGTKHHLSRGLLTRAWLRFLADARTGAQSAQEDLDEAWEIAEPGPMRLFMADIHLYRARLFHAVRPYPWNKNPDGTERGPKDDLAAARRLIEQCGYWRRKEELEDAEEAAREELKPRVYISYTWRTPGFKERALSLADNLRKAGIDSRLDLYHAKSLHGFVPPPPIPNRDAWDHWQEEEIKLADRIIVICSSEYASPPPSSGIERDLRYMLSDLKTSRDGPAKLIPVGVGPYESNAAYVPSFMHGATYYDIGTPQRGIFGVEDLVRRLKTEFPDGEIDRNPSLKPLPVRVFVSYAHEDERRLKRLDAMLDVLEQLHGLTFWVDKRLIAGEEWDAEIRRRLEEMDIFLFIASQTSLNRSYIKDPQIRRARERRDAGEVEIVTVKLEPCAVDEDPFLGRLQRLAPKFASVAEARLKSAAWEQVRKDLLPVIRRVRANKEKLAVR